MERFVYPAQTTSDEKDGGFVVQFVDFPEAVTQGADIVEAGAAASDCLEEVYCQPHCNGVADSKAIPHKKSHAVCLVRPQCPKLQLRRRFFCLYKKLRSQKWNSPGGLNAMKRKCVVYWILIINRNYQELSQRWPLWGRN